LICENNRIRCKRGFHGGEPSKAFMITGEGLEFLSLVVRLKMGRKGEER
jgi:hypothetical protein